MKTLFLLLIPCFVFGQDGQSRWVEKYTDLVDDTTISNYDTLGGSGWVREAGDSVQYDTEFVRNGLKSIKVYAPGSGTTTTMATSWAGSPKDFSSYDMFTISYRMSNDVKRVFDSASSNIALSFLTGSRYFYIQVRPTKASSFDNGWFKFTISKKEFTEFGTPAPKWDSLTMVKTSLKITSGDRYSVVFDQLKAGKSTTPKGGVIFWQDASDTSVTRLGNKIHDRYNIPYTMVLVARYQHLSNYPPMSEVAQMQETGKDVVVYPYLSDALTTVSNSEVEIRLNRVRDTLYNYGLKGASIVGYSQLAHDRRVDSIAIANGFSFGRGSITNRSFIGFEALKVAPFPLYTDAFSFNLVTYHNMPLDSMKMIVDSASANNIVAGFLFHGVNKQINVSTSIDTAKLDTLLKYCKDKIDAGTLGYAGKFTNYLLYAPNYMIRNKARSFVNRRNLQVMDSISLLADSMRIVLYRLNGSTWDSIAGTPMKKGGALCTLSVSGLAVGTHTFREWGKCNSGHIDSMLATYTVTMLPPTIVNIAVEATYLKGSFVVATGKTATINGTSKTVSAQTDSTATVVGRLRNNIQDTIRLTAGTVSDSVKVKYKYGSKKLIWQTR